MSYKRIRAYLFTKTYAYTIFQEYIHKAGKKEKHNLKRRIAKILLLKPNPAVAIADFNSILHHDGKLSIYVRIEHELIQLMNERKNRGHFDLIEYEYALLDPAIERVVGSDLCDIENDKEFDEQLTTFKTIYINWYYQTAAKYRLPTLRIIPFLLRLFRY